MTRPKTNGSTAPRLHDTVRLSARGLGKVLGDLEARILRAVWTLGAPSTAREVHERIVPEHDVSPLTTITVLNRLVTKRVLQRKKVQGLLHFSARLSEQEFMTKVSRQVVEGVMSFGPDAMATSFVDVMAEQNPEKLNELAALIQQRLRERNGE